MDKTCILCDRPIIESKLCEIHLTAYNNLNNRNKKWLKAFNGKLTMEEFLEKIVKLQDTGNAVKEMAMHLLRNSLKV